MQSGTYMELHGRRRQGLSNCDLQGGMSCSADFQELHVLMWGQLAGYDSRACACALSRPVGLLTRTWCD